MSLVGSMIPASPDFEWNEGPTIGRGAFGTVSLGIVLRHSEQAQASRFSVGATIAVKDIPLFSEASWLHACREAVALSLCQGPGVVHLHGLERAAPSVNSPLGRARLVMEYVPGGTLSQLAKVWASGHAPRGAASQGAAPKPATHNRESARGLPPVAVARYIRELLRAVARCHARGVAHRDIKGSNTLLGPDGEVCLADFGSARLPDEAEDGLRADIRSAGQEGAMRARAQSDGFGQGEIADARQERGTLQWMAPEVLLGALHTAAMTGTLSGKGQEKPRTAMLPGTHEWWCAADVWSVGATALELLSGCPPWTGLAEDSAGVQLAMACVDLRDELPSGTPPAARSFLMLCLHPDPNLRPTAAVLLLGHPFLLDADGPTVDAAHSFEWRDMAQKGANVEESERRQHAHEQQEMSEQKSVVASDSPSSSVPSHAHRGTTSELSRNRVVSSPKSAGTRQDLGSISWPSLLAGAAHLRKTLPLLRLACRQSERWWARSCSCTAPEDRAPSTEAWVEACACRDSVTEPQALLKWTGVACEAVDLPDAASALVADVLGQWSSRRQGASRLLPGKSFSEQPLAQHAGVEQLVIFGLDDSGMNHWIVSQSDGIRGHIVAAALSASGRFVIAAVAGALQHVVSCRTAVSPRSPAAKGGRLGSDMQSLAAPLALLLLNLLVTRVSAWASAPARLEENVTWDLDEAVAKARVASSSTAHGGAAGMPAVALAAGWLATARQHLMHARDTYSLPQRPAEGEHANSTGAGEVDGNGQWGAGTWGAQGMSGGAEWQRSGLSAPGATRNDPGWATGGDQDDEDVEDEGKSETLPAAVNDRDGAWHEGMETGPQAAVFQYTRVHTWCLEALTCLDALAVLSLARKACGQSLGIGPDDVRACARTERKVYAQHLNLRITSRALLRAAGLQDAPSSKANEGDESAEDGDGHGSLSSLE